MRLNGTISHEGLRLLERSFVPTIQKFGKDCYLIITPTDFHLIQTTEDADGVHTCATIKNVLVFQALTCESKHNNMIGLKVQTGLLYKALRAASAHGALSLQIKLGRRSFLAATETIQRPMIVLNGECDGNIEDLGQELPVLGNVLQSNDLDYIYGFHDVSKLCPFYVDIAPALQKITACAIKLKAIVPEVTLTITKYGDLHFTINSHSITLGEAIFNLEVVPGNPQNPDPAHIQGLHIEERLHKAQQEGHAMSVSLNVNHLIKALQTAPLSNPERVLCGVAEEKIYVHILFAYESKEPNKPNDDRLNLFYRIPVIEED